MGTTRKSDQSNASAINAEGAGDENVELVDHTAPDKTAARADKAAAKADKATAKATAAAEKATAKAAAAEAHKADVAEAKAQKQVDNLIHDDETAKAAKSMDHALNLKLIKYVGDTPQAQARQKAELKATLVNLLAFDGKIKDCSEDLREYIAFAEHALKEVNCS